MPRQTNFEVAQQNLRQQRAFMAERGRTREAYVGFYALFGRTEEDAVAIWEADKDALARCEARVEGLIARAARRVLSR